MTDSPRPDVRDIRSSGNDEEWELSLSDIIESILKSWRAMLAGAVLAPALTVGYSSFLGKSVAEVTLNNTCTGESTDESCPLTFSSLKLLTLNLPPIAAQWLQSGKMTASESAELGWLASDKWWEKHVVPSYAYTKADSKNLAGGDEKLKADGATIVNLKLSYEDRKPERAQKRMDQALRYFRDAAVFFETKRLHEGYIADLEITQAQGTAERLNGAIETDYLKARLADLKAMEAREGPRMSTDQVRVDIGSVPTHFLPLKTQINATEIILYDQEERKRKLLDKEAQNQIMQRYLELTQPYRSGLFEGKSAEIRIGHLMEAVSQMRKEIPSTDQVRQASLAQIEGDLIRIRTRFTAQFMEISRVVISPGLPLQALTGALFLGLFLGWGFSMGRRRVIEALSPDKRI